MRLYGSSDGRPRFVALISMYGVIHEDTGVTALVFDANIKLLLDSPRNARRDANQTRSVVWLASSVMSRWPQGRRGPHGHLAAKSGSNQRQ
ncbi:hypothetical protein RRG08_014146 [Elysia crispata]|uniref:Uncharacterized protein n=1 Tax=Elysia crispata TaxID=231223 RepID=A0AAE1DYC3_9GAST|nr:hypothetical protein RRG08_014146 [Elysia crispata]